MSDPEFSEILSDSAREREVESKPVRLKGGKELSCEEAAEALNAAMRIIECVGTTDHSNVIPAQSWMARYYPNWTV